MITTILYWLPLMICCIGASYALIKDRMHSSDILSFVFWSLIFSVTPVVNIIFAAFVLDEIDFLKAVKGIFNRGRWN